MFKRTHVPIVINPSYFEITQSLPLEQDSPKYILYFKFIRKDNYIIRLTQHHHQEYLVLRAGSAEPSAKPLIVRFKRINGVL